jgi:polygalacturonase
MVKEDAGRRKFLKLTGAAVAGTSLGSSTIQGPNSPIVDVSASSGDVFELRTFGAKGDGKTLDTPAINRAIETAAAAGGGTVRFSAGNYLSHSIHLRSNITIYLSPGATLIAAESPGQGGVGYDPPELNAWDKYQDFGHSHWHNSLIWGEGISNVSILGPGLIWGRGLSRGSGDTALAPGVGNKSISLKNCHNVILRDLSILHGGHFAVLATGVDNLTIDNLTIDTNRDGIDIDCCRNVRVSNCSVNSPWDDGICLKSSYGLGFARPTDHVTITNCYVTGCYEKGTLLDGTYKRIGPDYRAPQNGRIKFGTESNGGFRNITVSNCVIEGCHGLALETVDGGLLEDVSISNLTMRDITDVPFFLRLGRRMRGPEGAPVGQLRRVNISNVVVSNCASRQATIVTGIPGHYIEDVELSNIYVMHQGGGRKDDVAIQPSELENAYPEPSSFGPMPAHGFFIRHVKSIHMHDVEINYAQDDLRPALLLDDVEGAYFARMRLSRASNVPTIALNNVKDFEIRDSRPVPDEQFDDVKTKLL